MTEDEKIAETTEAPEAKVTDQQPKPEAGELSDEQLDTVAGGTGRTTMHVPM